MLVQRLQWLHLYRGRHNSFSYHRQVFVFTSGLSHSLKVIIKAGTGKKEQPQGSGEEEKGCGVDLEGGPWPPGQQILQMEASL